VTVSVKAYAKRYGVDRYTAYDDLTAIGFALPASAQHWAKRPPPTTRRPASRAEQHADPFDDPSWITLDGRLFFVAGYTSGGAPYGVFVDEMPYGAFSDPMSYGACSDEMPPEGDPF
jgi:hypothetical protein